MPLSPPLLPADNGRDTRLAFGLDKVPVRCAPPPGSMSREDKKEVPSSSSFVLVIVRKESSRLFCSAFGVPFRSRIWNTVRMEYATPKMEEYLLEVGK
jgi:hypothetical protein